MRDYFFQYLGLCWLHIELEGNLKHVITAIVSNFTSEQLQSAHKCITHANTL